MTRNILSPAPEIYVVLYFQQLWRSSIKVQNFDCVYYSVEWAIASHGMYESTLVFISILKQKNLYIVGCVQCDIWDIIAYLLLPELKYYYENE
jgi:hypothetical protein